MEKNSNKSSKKKIFVGYYGLSVIMTYLGVISSIIGVYFALTGKITLAIICLIVSGICDAFDGKIARSLKRSKEEKKFGIQLDSLSDMVDFIFLPIAIFYGLGFSEWYNILIFVIYAICGISRLAYFNIVAEEDSPVPYYSGLPVTSSALIFPLLYILRSFVNTITFGYIYTIAMLIISILFVVNFKVKKPQGYAAYLFLILGVIGILLILYFNLNTGFVR